MVRIGPVAFDQLVEALSDDEWAIRERGGQCAWALSRSPRHRSPHAGGKDKDGAVRTAAVWAMERIGDSRATPGLIEAGDGTVREDVAGVLKRSAILERSMR
ncbi:MAG: HEAT repeat domain-containing protein [Nitrospira sp.]|nr:HEAT repeat domain-containing protein [Nitrospira sp.]